MARHSQERQPGWNREGPGAKWVELCQVAEMKRLDELPDHFKVCGDGWLPVNVFLGDDG